MDLSGISTEELTDAKTVFNDISGILDVAKDIITNPDDFDKEDAIEVLDVLVDIMSIITVAGTMAASVELITRPTT